MAKLFYFMRRSNIENQFGFFLEPMHSSLNESDIIIFEKLCSCNFYVDELDEFYFRYLKLYIVSFVEVNCPSSALEKCLRSGFNAVNFTIMLKIFEDLDGSLIESFLSIWLPLEPISPQQFFEAVLAYSFPSTKFLYLAEKYDPRLEFTSEFTNFLQEKASKFEFFEDRWRNIVSFNNRSAQSPYSKVHNLKSKDILANLKSVIPADIVFGLFEFRKSENNYPNFVLSAELMDSLVDCLYHEDRYSST